MTATRGILCVLIRSWHLALESGRFWFPAQVYNRKSEHVGFMLSCYDPELAQTPSMQGDHFEIQWRRNKEFPYGWWYGVVGHLESCGGNELHCRCVSNGKKTRSLNVHE